MIDDYVKIDGVFEDATLTLVTIDELSELDLWSDRHSRGVAQSQKTTDILEYTRNALDKHGEYSRYDRCPADWQEFIRIAASKTNAEIAGIFVLKSNKLAEEILGFIFVRRNWEGGLVLDYLVPRPNLHELVQGYKLSGVGTTLFILVCKLAALFNASFIWWETSPESVDFYYDLLKFKRKKSLYKIYRKTYKNFLVEHEI